MSMVYVWPDGAYCDPLLLIESGLYSRTEKPEIMESSDPRMDDLWAPFDEEDPLYRGCPYA